MAASRCFRRSQLFKHLLKNDVKTTRGSSMRSWTKLITGRRLDGICCDAKMKTQMEPKAIKTTTKTKTQAKSRLLNLRESIPESLEWIADQTPNFPVDGDKIRVLKTPQQFYSTMLAQIGKAKRRVTLASLYLGTGETERKLVDELLKKDENVDILIVLDHSRGSRGRINSFSMLQKLLKTNCKVSVSLFHTPQLRGILKYFAPDRWNELLGLQHMKIFVFDDDVLISGANLSHDYFTNRQDRYFLFENCRHLARFLHEIVFAVSTFSLQLDADGGRHLHRDWTVHPFRDDQDEFKSKARQRILKVVEKERKRVDECVECDTLVTPLLQLGSMGLTQDETFTKKLLASTPSSAKAVMATGYFNLTDEYKKAILNQMAAPISIIMAAPKVNGFYRARGAAGAIPSAYTNLALQFYQQIALAAQRHRIRLFEYERDSWTFHSKGFWLYSGKDENLPFLTLIGSPNFGYRSVRRDLELQCAVMTNNSSLKRQLREEEEAITKRSLPVSMATYSSSERFVPLWVRLVTHFLRDFF